MLKDRYLPGIESSVAGYLLLLCCVFLCAASESAAAAGGDADFLIPGLDFSTVSFRRGAAVEYLVVSEAYGVRDSSRVRLSVISSSGGLTELEITTAPWTAGSEEALFLRVLFSDSLKEAQSADELYSYIISAQVREGDEPFRKASRDEIEDYELGELFLESGEAQRERLEDELVSTPAGDFRCQVYRYRKEKKDTVNLGGNDALRLEKKTSFLHLCGAIPLTGLARSETTRESRTELDIPGIPRGASRSKKTHLESTIIDFKNPSTD